MHPANEMTRLAVPINPTDHVRGTPSAPVTLLEYGDYQCPYCGRAQLVLRELLRRHRGDVLFAFRHFPLVEIHPRALPAALAAEAAGAQGEFWAMHDALFARQDALEDEDLLAYAYASGLDVQAIAHDLREARYLPKIRADVLSGEQSGVTGTPTFFVNGLRAEGWDLDTLEAAIASAEGASAHP